MSLHRGFEDVGDLEGVSLDPVEPGPDIQLICGPAPRPKRPDTQTWEPNRCANFIQTTHIQGVAPISSVVAENHREGYTQLITFTPVRGNGRFANNTGDETGELCSYHTGRLAIDRVRGRGVGVTCFDPEEGDRMLQRNAVSRPFVATLGKWARMLHARSAGLRVGYTYFAGGYPTPMWIENFVTAPKHFCGIPT